VYGVLRTADAVTPFLTASAALTTLILFVLVYAFIFSFGTFYIYRLLRAGPAGIPTTAPGEAAPNRPMSMADKPPIAARSYISAGE
jgi:cytochrome d ubiquinol oxidase subunit I